MSTGYEYTNWESIGSAAKSSELKAYDPQALLMEKFVPGAKEAFALRDKLGKQGVTAQVRARSRVDSNIRAVLALPQDITNTKIYKYNKEKYTKNHPLIAPQTLVDYSVIATADELFNAGHIDARLHIKVGLSEKDITSGWQVLTEREKDLRPYKKTADIGYKFLGENIDKAFAMRDALRARGVESARVRVMSGWNNSVQSLVESPEDLKKSKVYKAHVDIARSKGLELPTNGGTMYFSVVASQAELVSAGCECPLPLKTKGHAYYISNDLRSIGWDRSN